MPIPPEKIAEWKATSERYRANAYGGRVAELRLNPLYDPNFTHAEADDWQAEAAEATESLLSEREEMLSLLRDLEWVKNGRTGNSRRCPCCDASPPREGWESVNGPHSEDCRLSAFIKGQP